jgi:hypothetical protein
MPVRQFKEFVPKDHASMGLKELVCALEEQTGHVVPLIAANGAHQEDYQVHHLFVNVTIRGLNLLKMVKSTQEHKDQ